MNSRRLIQVKNRSILFSTDDSAPAAARAQAVVKLRITDELTGVSPDTAPVIEVRERGFMARVAEGGFGGLIAIPRQVFPSLQTMDYFVHATVSAAQYLPRELEIKVPIDPGFPSTFSAPHLNVALHRAPVFISGRTVRGIGSVTAPLGGAVVEVTGVWRTAPPANVAVAPDPPDLVSIQPPLYLDRAATAHSLERRDLTPVPGDDKQVVDDTPSGAISLRLLNRLGLVAGDILLIDADQQDLTEFIAIKLLPMTAPADEPTSLTLDHPLRFPHRRGAVVRRANAQPPGPARQFTVDAISGDATVFLDAVIGLAAGQEVQVTGAPGPDEYHRAMIFSVTSDAEGFYRLPPLNRVAQFEVHAEKTVAGQTFKATTVFSPSYRQRENRLDLVLAV